MAEFPRSRIDIENRLRRLLGESPNLTTLAGTITSSTTTITLTSAVDVKDGTKLEIEEEEMLVDGDPSGSTVTVHRGYGGTAAAAHNSDVTVRIDARHKKSSLVEAINVVLNNWISRYMPRFVWDSTTGGTFLANHWIYPVSSDAIRVRRVLWKVPGFRDVQDVEFGPVQPYPTDIVSTGFGVPVYRQSKMFWGRTVHILTEQAWPHLDGDNDTVPSDYPSHADDLIVTGAALYHLGWRITPKLRLDESVFARESSEPVPQNFNVNLLERMKRDWVMNMNAVMNQRPSPPSPSKVWVP